MKRVRTAKVKSVRSKSAARAVSSGVARRASIFQNGANQAVRLPREMRFPTDVKEMRIRKQGDGLVITPVKPNWASFFALQTEVQTIFSRTAPIRIRSRVIHCDWIHAGYGYIQLHHQAPTSDID